VQLLHPGRRLLPTVVALLTGSLLVATSPAAASLTPQDFEDCLLARINADRAAAGAGLVAMAYDLNPEVRGYSEKMAREGELRHMTPAERNPILPDGTYTWGENVAWHSSSSLPGCATIHDMFMGSSGHRANILNPTVRFVSLGVYIGGNGTWVTELFFAASGYDPGGPEGNGTFWDDDGSAFEPDIEWLAGAGITRGCNPPLDTRFCPGDVVTRDQMAAFLVRALELTDQGDGNPFTDDNGSIFEPDITKLAAAGITQGCNPPDNDRFCPGDVVTRDQMAAFLVRALELTDQGDGNPFTDDNGSIFEPDITKLAAAGITQGCNPPDNNHYCPQDPVTRQQMAAFLHRGLDR
jgi:hypothetical protein